MNNNLSFDMSKHPARLAFVLGIIFMATLARIVIHVPNFSPIDAIALLSGVCFGRRLFAVFVVFMSVWSGDIFLNKMYTGNWQFFYAGWYWQYGAWFLITLIGIQLRDKVNSTRLLSATLASSILFFVISNFGVWCSGLLYPMTFEGLRTCYVAAIPFFKNTLLSDLFFTAFMFGAWGLVQPRLLPNKKTF